jgi:small conductance mechanosensitive channel
MLLCSFAVRLVLALGLPFGMNPVAAAAAASSDKSHTESAAVDGAGTGAGAGATTQPAVAADEDAGLMHTFSHTTLGQLAQGKKKVSLNEMKDPAFWIDTIKDLVIAVAGLVPRILVSLIFLVVFWGVYRGLRKILHASLAGANVDDSIRELLTKGLKWGVMGFGLVIACNQVGIPIVAMLTGFSIIGLAVGFAAQETLANFIAGIVIFWDKPFRVGDIISVEGTFGEVQRVTFRSTRMITGDGEMVVMPNTAMLNRKLINNSAQPKVRVRVPIGLPAKTPAERARAVLMPLLNDDPRVLKDPAPSVLVTECTEARLTLEMRFWTEAADQLRAIHFETLGRAKAALERLEAEQEQQQAPVDETSAPRATQQRPIGDPPPRIAA